MNSIPHILLNEFSLLQALNVFPALGRFLSLPLKYRFLLPSYPWIAVEGVDGSGKGSFIEALRGVLKQRGLLPPVLMRMPGGTIVGEQLREAMLSKPPTLYGDTTIAAAMRLNVATLLDQCIWPVLKLSAGLRHLRRATDPWLVSDRWALFSGAVYQTDYFRFQKDGDISLYQLSREFGQVCPPVVVYMSVTPETSLRRRPPTGDSNQFEAKADQRRVFIERYDDCMNQLCTPAEDFVTTTIPEQVMPFNSAKPIVLRIDNDTDMDENAARHMMYAQAGRVVDILGSCGFRTYAA